MKTKTLISVMLSIFSLVMLLGVTNAASLELTEVSIPITANHNSEITIIFNVTNAGATDYYELNWSGSFTNIGSWKTLPTLTSLDVGETEQLSAILTIPEYSSGTINAEIDLQCETSSEAQLPFTITINETPSLEVSDLTIAEGDNSGTITITNTGNTNLTNVALTYSGDFDVSFNSTGFNLNAGESKNVLITITTDLNDLDMNNNEISVTATSGDTSASGTVTVDASYCRCNNYGELNIEIEDINVKEGFGSNEDWYPLDEVEVEIRVENNGDWDIKNIEVEWGLYSSDQKDFLFDDTESEFDLKDGDDETIIITFQLENPEDYENGDFIFYTKATGEIDDSDSDYDGNKTCDEDSQSINMVIQKDFVTFKNIDFPNSTTCGVNAQITADVWNIGTRDQKDFSVTLYNKELGISEEKIFDKINSFDNDEVIFDIKIPENAEAKSYVLKMEIIDEDGDVYESEDGDKASFSLIFNVEGNCGAIEEKDILITASLESGGKAGEELVVKSTITNAGSKSGTFTFDIANYEDWAELEGINKNILILESGQSEDVIIKLNVNKDAAGDKDFNIKVTEDSTLVEQSVTVTIEKSGFFDSVLTGNLVNGNASLLWGLGIVNVILIILIIIVAIRLMRK